MLQRVRGIAEDLARFGAAPALIGPDGSLSYAELDARVQAAADALGPVRRVVTLTATNTVDAVVAYLAAQRAGHPLIVCGDDAAGADLHARYADATELHPDLALLLSTSGSTGTPKLVRLSHDNLATNAAAIAEYLGLTPDDRAITTLPLHYCYGLSVLNSHLSVGASVVLTDLSVVDACFWDLARQHAVTSFAGVPHTFELLDRIGFTGDEVPSLRYVTQAGGRMPAERVARYAQLTRLVVMYGQTEATARMAYLPPELAAGYPSAIGRAIPGGELRIDDTGELVYRGPNVMMGYAYGPADLGRGAEHRELRTGDLAREVDGLFEIVGRCSRIIKPFGVRIDLDDLERCLAVDGIDAMCAGDDQRVVIGVSSDDRDLRDDVAERLNLPPSRVVVARFAALPYLTNGKADYARVAAAVAVPEPKASSVRAAYTAAFERSVDGEDSFVSLGGDSLSYVEVSLALEDALGELPRDWHLRTVAELEALAAPRSRRRVFTQTETSVVLRVAAIVLIVGNHTRLWQQAGGAHALIAVAGFNFARFQLASGQIVQSVARVAIPAMVCIGMIAAFSDQFGWTHALLVNDVLGGRDSRWAFWFVEALVQISLVLAAVFAVPAVARFERRRPFATAALAVAAGLVIRFDLIEPTTSKWVWWPHDVFWLFALGWAGARATKAWQRLAVCAVAALSLPGFFTNTPRAFIVGAAIAAITWLPTVPVPRALLRLATPLASASLYIYLIHIQLHPVLGRSFGPLVATLGSLVTGVAAWRVVQAVERFARAKRPAPGSRATAPARAVRRLRRAIP